jgi:hypothetical protein
MDKELLIKIFFFGGGEGWGCSLDPIFELEPIQKTHAQYTKRTHGTYLVSCISLLLYHQSNLLYLCSICMKFFYTTLDL